jgi:hypothetical protein
MSGLQSWVYAIEVGGIRKWITRGVLVAVWMGLAVFYFLTEFIGFSHAEAMDQAQLGRQISEGKGFTTQFIRPLAIWQLRASGKRDSEIDLTNFPDTVNAPLYPLVAAAAFKVTGASLDVTPEEVKDFRIFAPERILVAVSLGFFLGTLLILYVWARWLFDDVVATTAVLFLMATGLVWEFAISGLNTMLAMFLITCAGLLVHVALWADEEGKGLLSLVGLAVAALLIGLACMTQYVLGWLVIPLVILAALAFERRWVAVPLVVIIFLAACLPWWLRNIGIVGNPLGLSWAYLVEGSGPFPGNTIWRTLELQVSQVLSPREILRDAVRGVLNQSAAFAALAGGILLASLAVGCVFHRFRSSLAAAQHWFWAGSVLMVLFFAGLTFSGNPDRWFADNRLVIFLPILLIFATAFLYVLLDRIQLPLSLLKYFVVGLILVVHALPMVRDFMTPQRRIFAYPPYFPPILFLMKPWSEPTEVQAGDIPWAQAWYQNRPTVWLPKEKEQFFTINDLMKPIVMVLITPETTNARYYSEIQKGEYKDWANLILRRGGDRMILPFATALPPPAPPAEGEYFLLADRMRWR